MNGGAGGRESGCCFQAFGGRMVRRAAGRVRDTARDMSCGQDMDKEREVPTVVAMGYLRMEMILSISAADAILAVGTP